MKQVLHVLDTTTSPDAWAQMRLLAGDEAKAVSLGPAPAWPWGGEGPAAPSATLRCPLGWTPLAWRELAVHAAGAEVIHAWSPRAAAGAAAAAHKTGIPLLISLACGRQGRKLDALSRRLLRRGRARLIVPTRAAQSRLESRGLDATAVSVLPYAVAAVESGEQARRAVREALGVAEDHVLLVAPAEMTRGAGHKYASWAHGILRQIGPEYRLALPGGGPVERHVRTFAQSTGYGGEVYLTGARFSRQAMLAAADVALHLSDVDVGLAGPLAALAAGTALVATHVPDTAEHLTHEQNALLAPPRTPRLHTAAVLHVLEDPDLARRLARAGSAAVRSLCPEAIRPILAEVYERV